MVKAETVLELFLAKCVYVFFETKTMHLSLNLKNEVMQTYRT